MKNLLLFSASVVLAASFTISHAQQSQPPVQPPAQQNLPQAPSTLKSRPTQTPADAAEALRISKLALINGVPYDQPSHTDIFHDYLRDTYGLPALVRTVIRASYAQARGKPTGWGDDAAGFGQRIGANAFSNLISGNVRYGFEELFKEDLRYLPCHRCTIKHKIENALLSEITARHDQDGHRFFTLTPTIADFSGPIVSHVVLYPGSAAGPIPGTVSARTAFATRIGAHLFREFVLDRHAEDPHHEDH